MNWSRTLAAVAAFLSGLALHNCSAQTKTLPPYEIYAGYAWQSNTFNGLPGNKQGMNGFQAGVGFPAWHGLRPRVEYSRFTANNLGASEKVFAITGGGQYEHAIGFERLFVDAMFGDLGMNRYWGPKGVPGESASFTTMLGGGADTPISHHLAIRVEADWRNENLALIKAVTSTTPYRVPGLPQNFAVLSTSLVWMPKAGETRRLSPDGLSGPREPVAQELIFESLNSFGHVKIFANSWWSYLNVAGVEYTRHSWGHAAGADLDYVAEILPVAFFRQPSKSDIYGNNHSGTQRTMIEGLGISPVGLRMMWLDKHAVRPYYEIKGGMIGFTHKAISPYSSYENFSLQQAVGFQARLSSRVDLRGGVGVFHFSNAFVVPSNPGIDSMSWNAGLSYHLHQRSWIYK